MLERAGPAGVSLRAAARRAGVSHNAPYRHFADRGALLAALAAEGCSLLETKLHGLRGRPLGEAYVRFALEHPQRFRLMSQARLAHVYEIFVAAFRAEALARPEVAAAAAWSVVHGLATLLVDGHLGAQAPEEFAREVLESVRFAAGPRPA